MAKCTYVQGEGEGGGAPQAQACDSRSQAASTGFLLGRLPSSQSSCSQFTGLPRPAGVGGSGDAGLADLNAAVLFTDSVSQ